MFRTFFFSELKYSLRQPLVYIFMAIFATMEFFATVSDNVQIGGAIGGVYRNSPFTLTQQITILCLFSVIMAATFFNNAALRDYDNQFHEILFTTPLSKPGYFFGRFFGALVIATLPLLGVFVGMLLGTYMNTIFGWLETNRFGPFNLEMYLNNYLLFILPNMFLAGVFIYALAHTWKRTVISFVGSMVIVVAYIVATTLTSDITNETLAGLSDIFGINTYDIETKYFTTVEKNTISPSFSGVLLKNRLVWSMLGLLILLLSYFNFSFKEKNQKVRKPKQTQKAEVSIFNNPRPNPSFTANSSWMQFKSFFYTNFLSIVKSVTFKILFLFCLIILVVDLIGGHGYLGSQSYPLTYRIIDSMKGRPQLFPMIITVFFSGELVWRDRDVKINEVIDATPFTSCISMVAKTLSLLCTVSIFNLFFIGVGIVYQLLNGYTRIELDVYLLDFLYRNLPLFTIISGMTIVIQVLTSNKYVGYFIAILILFVSDLFWLLLDISSNMLNIMNTPRLQYSDMDGFGPGLKAALWFNVYWVVLAILGLLIAGALWNRGTKSPLVKRLKKAKSELPKSYGNIIILTTLVWMGVAGFVYYNTQVVNPYQSEDTKEQLAAAYEKKYGKYRNVVSPKITDAKYAIDIFPSKRNVHAKALIELSNTTSKPIDSLHIYTQEGWDASIEIPNATVAYTDKTYKYTIYSLDPPLQPEEKTTMKIAAKYLTQGFGNDRGNIKIVHNGTFFDNTDVLPVMGYHRDLELDDKNLRRKYKLPPKNGLPKLTKAMGPIHMCHFYSEGRPSDFIPMETVISTSLDQTAIAPGSLKKQWEEKNRKYFHYKTDTPSLAGVSFMSADYEIAKRKWKGIDLEIYYDEKHSVNIEMMLDAVQRSLEYYTKHFGPYHHKQARIIEFPRYRTFAQAFAGTMPCYEGFGFVTNLEDESDNNIIDAVIAHEMAHQWWGHQVVGAYMQGSEMLSESLAEYSSLMTLKSIANTPMKMRQFLKYDHDRYLRGRSNEHEKELPLYKTEKQGYVHYGKGSIVLYALQDYIGEDKVNAALKRFLEAHKPIRPPYPSSHDFLRHLEPQVPDSLKYLITDGFREITLYDNRLKEANYKKLDTGKYEVTLEIESTKIKSDGMGNETKVSLDDWIDVGFFMDEDEAQLYQQKRLKFNAQKSVVTLQLDSLPVKAAIDPRYLLIDRVYKDNIKRIRLKE